MSRHATKVALVGIGLLSTVLAVLGIFLPLLPTVPLLLLAAACFARSSERLHRRLLDHPRLGSFVTAYRDGAGIPKRAKIRAIGLIWFTITVSIILTPVTWVRFLLFLIAVTLTVYLLRFPTHSPTAQNRELEGTRQ